MMVVTSRFIFQQYCPILGQSFRFVNRHLSKPGKGPEMRPETPVASGIMACDLLFTRVIRIIGCVRLGSSCIAQGAVRRFGQNEN
jgi:hypothetical protein